MWLKIRSLTVAGLLSAAAVLTSSDPLSGEDKQER